MNNTVKKILKVIFALLIGMFITLLLLEIILRIIGWWEVNRNSFLKIDNSKNELRILALGDSMTALGGINSYPNQLEKKLNDSKKIDKKVRVVNGGVVMTSSTDLFTNIKSNLDKYNPKIVMVMTGINDNIESNYKSTIVKKIKNSNTENILYNKNIIRNKDNFLFRFKVTLLFSNLIWNINEIWITDYDKLIKEGNLYGKSGNLPKAISFYLKAVIKNIYGDAGYFKLFQYLTFLPFRIRIQFCELAYKLNQGSYNNNLCMSNKYKKAGYSQGLSYLKELSKKFPKKTEPALEVARLAFSKKDYKTAREYLDKALIIDDNYPKKQILDLLAKIYFIEGNVLKNKEMVEKISFLTEETRKNYQEIAELCRTRGIKLISIQYPMRDVNILKSYFTDSSNVYFVDNNQSFEDAVNKYGYDQVFIDAFAGDFGHGSPLGNKIIAENVAKVILDNNLIFSQQTH